MRNRREYKILIGVIFLFATNLFAEIDKNIKFDGVDLKPDTIYKYRKKPLDNNSRYKYANYQQKYSSMTTTITDAEYSDLGDAYIKGVTKLKFRSPGLGYTGGVFIIVKDSYGGVILILSAKTGTYMERAEAEEDEAKEFGWGIDWTIGSHDEKKWNSKYGFKFYRTVEWGVIIPAVVMENNPTIEIVQCHTPSYRALNALKEFTVNGFSFVVYNALPVAELVIHIMNKDIQYIHFSNLTRSIVDWTYSCQYMNNIQYNSVISIVDSCDRMAGKGLLGIQPGNHRDLINLVSIIRSASNGSANAADSGRDIFNSLFPLLTNIEDFRPSSFEDIVNIMKNLQILLNEDGRLSSKQNEQFTQVISVSETFLMLENNTPAWKHIGLLFEGVNLAIEISRYDSNLTQPQIFVLREKVFSYLNKIRNAAINEYGVTSIQVERLDSVFELTNVIFDTINVSANWQTDLITTSYRRALEELIQE